MSAYITFDNIAKHYHRADVITRALDGASFCVEQGELAVILGPSGAGKTTALNILGGTGYRHQRTAACGWQRYHRLQSQTAGGIPAL